MLAGLESTFVAERPTHLVTRGDEVFVGTGTGVWRWSDADPGRWARASAFPDGSSIGLAAVGEGVVFATIHRGAIRVVGVAGTDVPANVSGVWAGDPASDVFLQAGGDVWVSRDLGASLSPLWPRQAVESLAWAGGPVLLSDFGRMLRSPDGISAPGLVQAANLPNPAMVAGQLSATLVASPLTRDVVYAVYGLADRDGIALFEVFRSDDAGSTWVSVLDPVTLRPGLGPFLERTSSPSLSTLPAAIDPTDPNRLVFGIQRVWELRGGDAKTLSAMVVDPIAVGVTSKQVWAASASGVQSVAGGVVSDRNRGRGGLESIVTGTHHADVAQIVAAGTRSLQPDVTASSRAHPIWTTLELEFHQVLIREASRQWVIGSTSDVRAADRFGNTFRPLSSAPGGLARAPSDSTVLYGSTSDPVRLVRITNDVEVVIPEFTTHNPLNQLVEAIAVSHTDPDRSYTLLPSKVVRIDFAPTGSTAVTILLPPGLQPDDVPSLAVGGDDQVLYLAIGLRDSDRAITPRPRLWRLEPASGIWRDLTPAGGQPGPDTPLETIVVIPQPAGPDRLIVAGEGVWQSRDGGVSWESIGHGLPAGSVHALAVHTAARRLRAFTATRGVWERDLELPPCGPLPREIELYLRSHDLDDGHRQDVLDPVGATRTRTFRDADGMRIDDARAEVAGKIGAFQTPPDLTPEGVVDTIAFQQLENREPTVGSTARVYVEVHNRGPDPATGAMVFVAWAPFDGTTFPRFQESFWRVFPSTVPDEGPWIRADLVRAGHPVHPGEPAVARIDWKLPKTAPRNVAVVAIVHDPEDPVFAGVDPDLMGRDPLALAQANRRVLLRTIAVRRGPRVSVEPPEPDGEDHSTRNAILTGVAILAVASLIAVASS